MRITILFFFLFHFFTVQSQSVAISGRCYYDVNGNHLFDGIDSVLAGVPVNCYGSSGVFTNTTNAFGQYNFTVPLDIYDIGVGGLYDAINYNNIGYQNRNYTAAGSDIIDFAYQKRDSIVSISAYFDNANELINPSGISNTYKLVYGYDGSLPTMPATVTLHFSSKLSIINSSLTPNLSTPGFLQWNFSNLQRDPNYINPMDSIILTFQFPAVGDTIGSFLFDPKFIPGTAVSTNYYHYVYNHYQGIQFPSTNPIGTSNGLKWLRQYSLNSNFGNEECQAVDTCQNGNFYFVAGRRAALVQDSFQPAYNVPYISKINNDGLTIWEKYLDSLPGNPLNTSISAIKPAPDGGLFLLSSSSISDSSFIGIDNAVQVLRFDSIGNLVWSKYLNGSDYDEPGWDILVFSDGSSMITGNTKSHDGDFINSHADTLFNNVFLTKLSPTGSILFTKIYGGAKDDWGYHLKQLQNGNILISATTESNDGDVTGAHTHYVFETNGIDTVFSEEAWIIQVNATGNIMWNKCYGGSKNSYFSGMADNNGGILLAGYTDSKNGDLPYYPEAFVTLWALQISNTGAIQWSKLHKLYKGYQDSNYISYPYEIDDNYFNSNLHKTKDGSFIIGGTSSDKYGPIKGKHGKADFSLVKLSSTGDIIWQKAFGGTNTDIINDIIVDKNDDILYGGFSQSENDDLYLETEPNRTRMIVAKAGITNTIKGKVFIDNNANHIMDPGELVFSEGRVNSAKRTDTIQGRIFNGLYLNNVDTGNYSTKYKGSNNYYIVYPPEHISNFTSFDMSDSINFALEPKPNINDLEVTLLPINPPRPGFNVSYRVITKNVGTTTLNNVAIHFFKDYRQTYFDASRPVSGGVNDSLWWPPITLHAFEIDTLDISFTQDAPPYLNVGDTLSLHVTVEPVIGDSSANNNTSYLRQLVQGSFDPNEKSEIHAGNLTTTQYVAGEQLSYYIQFQNTGTDTAFFITIKDTLPSNVDWHSLEMVAASHPYNFNMNGNIATWNFRNILLPDSSTNETASHGFVRFTIKPITGLNVGTVFTNNAAIYFDYNLPVITNIASTTIGNNPPICPSSNATFIAGITGNTYQWQVNSGNGYTNISNSIVYSGATTATLQLDSPPTSLGQNKYRCLIDGNQFSPEYVLRFEVEWNGSINSDWENTSNWNCGVLPDGKTAVVIPSTAINLPVINSTAYCYSLRLAQGTSLTVLPTFKLTITGNAP